jgi:hypothetical protein
LEEYRWVWYGQRWRRRDLRRRRLLYKARRVSSSGKRIGTKRWNRRKRRCGYRRIRGVYDRRRYR